MTESNMTAPRVRSADSESTLVLPTVPAETPGGASAAPSPAVAPSSSASKPSSRSAMREAGRAVQEAVRAVLAIPRLGTWVGLILITVGFVMLMVGWMKTAATLNIGLQMPYLISAGLGGLGLIGFGILLIALDAKADDARLRSAQMIELRELVAQLNRAGRGRS